MQDPVRFGRYVLERRLAVGGMAEVFLARVEGPRGFEKRVVIKRILPNLVFQERYVEMFLDEARIAAHFNHPNVVQVYELTEVDGQFCLVMEYIEGEDIATVLDACEAKHRLVPLEIAAFVIAEAAEGLNYVHNLRDEEGAALHVVHRDVSPANVIITRKGPIKVVDFGIAKHTASMSHTQTGVLKGKYSYMSPEQVRGQDLDPRSDIFSLGTVLYELLTVTRCFTQENPYSTLDAVSRVDFKPVQKVRKDVPADLVKTIGRMLQKDVHRRFESAAEVSASLRQFLATRDLPTSADLNNFLDDILDHVEPTQPVPRMHLSTIGTDVVPVPKEFEQPDAMVDERTHQVLLDELMGDYSDTYSGNWSGLEAGGDPAEYTSAETFFEALHESAANGIVGLNDKASAIHKGFGEMVTQKPWLPAGVILSIGMIIVVALYQRAVALRSEQIATTAAITATATAEPDGVSGAAGNSSDDGAHSDLRDTGSAVGDTPDESSSAGGSATDEENSSGAAVTQDTGDAQSTGPPESTQTEVLIKSDPSGAAIHVDGEPLGDITPVVLRFAPGEKHEFIFEKEGFVTTRKKIEVEAESHQKVIVEMAPAPGKGAATPPRKSRVGYLTITSDPRVDVLLKGKRLGSTPLKHRAFLEGSYSLVLRHASGVTKSVRISIASGKATSRHIGFKKGRVIIQVRPWAHVYLGKKKLGTTPMPPFNLYEGSHKLRLVNPERGERTIKVTVRPGETTKVAETL